MLERWIADSPYRCTAQPGQSDLDVAKGSNAREILENHWDHWITEDDWSWISQRGLNAVRIPVSSCLLIVVALLILGRFSRLDSIISVVQTLLC